ncbi:hypothetical protein SAMN05421823_11598 [Catalinimonas alkaloidigena]|uniref:Cell wall binding repeat 2 n=1 Tax=Catalinimonas alkaloidigena TaxID=1075417 RepID=A0A1G9U5K3_9BACT|nr:hypothetical protein [Catalinimonas alkaloidigena]SDM55270.1 hypothetical protein SAMN05421823_11598 [Catalinimonas alkaloidigena]
MKSSLLFLATSSLLFSACGTTQGPPGAGGHPLQQEALATAYTVRLPGHSPEEQAILLTQTVYPATREDNAVGAIILCPQDPQLAYMAMHRVTHMPVNAPLLYLDKNDRLSEQTLREMKRLQPEGVLGDHRTDVYGLNVPATEVKRVEELLGYKVRNFQAPDPVSMAELLDRWAGALKADHPDEVVLSAVDHPASIAHGVGPMGWNAHMGKGFAWVYHDSIPHATRRMLERRYGEAYLYVVGDTTMVSDRVVRELAQYGIARRLIGPTPQATSALNAGYKDYGRNYAWWWDWDGRAFGWGIAQSGHNYIIGTPDDLLFIIPAAVLGHMGKHGPILLVERDSVPSSVRDYLTMVKPSPTGSQETVLNYAWIIGDTSRLTAHVQQTVDRLLSPFPMPVDTTLYVSDTDPLGEKAP